MMFFPSIRRGHKATWLARAWRAGARRSQNGSAYITVLLVMLVLTMMGLVLSLVTQTEMEIGANERLINRTFYAADAGIEVAIARALVTNDYTAKTFLYKDVTSGPVAELEFGSEVSLTPMLPILDLPCNLCEINNASTYQGGGSSLRKINYAVTSTAVRYGLGGNGTRRPLASKQLSATIQVEPWHAATDALLALNDQALIDQIKF